MLSARMVGNRYRLLELVGRGGMGMVWRAWEDDLDRPVAIKEIALPPDVSAQTWAEIYARTVREARAAARIGHPGVAAVYGMSERDEMPPWIAMEFVPGRSLARLLADEGPLTLARTVAVGKQVLTALDAGHAKGVLHRDLKPSNLMITPEGRAVLTDFGIARLVGAPRLTVSGAISGTVAYMSPERLLGQDEGSPASDLWAFGATLFAAVHGQGPYDGYTEVGVAIAAITTREPPELPEGGPLAGLIRALLSRDPALRPDAAQTARALDASVAATKARPAVSQSTRSAPYNGDTKTLRPDGSTPGFARHARRRGQRRLSWRKPALIGGTVTAVVAAACLTGVYPARGATESAPFRVATAINSDGHPELFAVARDGTLVHAWDTVPAAGWSAWQTLLPQQPSPDHVTGTVAAALDASGSVEVFARSTSGKMMSYWQVSGGNWAGPQPIGADTVTSDAAVVMTSGRTLEVFARLANGSIGYDEQAKPGRATSWSGWKSMGGGLASRPVAIVNTDGSPEVFAIAVDGGLVHDYYLGGVWSGWQPLAPGLAFTGTPAVGMDADGRLEVFARTPAGVLYYLWQESAGSGPWSEVAALGSGLHGDPAVITAPGHRLEVFAPLSGGIGYVVQQPTSSTGWSGWRSLPGQVDSALTAVSVPKFGRIDVFARTAGGGILDYRSTSGTEWTDAYPAGGSF